MTNHHAVRLTAAADQLVIDSLTIADSQVLEEARYWTTGARGSRCADPGELADADLTQFATEAMSLGAKMLTMAAQTTEARAVDRMLREVGEKTAQAARAASEATATATTAASETVTKAAAEATKAITDADALTRKHVSEAVATAKDAMVAETRRMFGGENPELLERLQPLLDKFAVALEKQVQSGTAELLEKATKQLDPSDPTSPMAKQAAALAKQQEQFTQQIEKGQAELAAKVDHLGTALAIRDAKAELAKVTPIKGGSFEEELHPVLREIAAGLGDEYADTTRTVGLVPRSKKGDGLLSVSGEPARVVVEMTDSARANWGEYFDEAERNRGAVASLGIVRSAEQNNDSTFRVLGKRRVVMAFDPAVADADLLRTVVLLLKTVAVAASVRTGAAEIDAAEEKIAEALKQLDKIDTVKKATESIQRSATKIDSECVALAAGMRRLLAQAQVALAGQTPDPVQEGPGAIHGVA